MANTNSAFDRWGKAFNGLHILMGYGAGTFDQPYEGNRFAELALSGKPIIDAWFQTGIEIQASTNGMSPPFGPRVYVAAMWAELAPNTTRWDRIWGRGYVSPDPVGPTKQLWLMWSGT